MPEITEFIIETDARDSGGRTIEASETYRCGKKSLYFILQPQTGFTLDTQTIGIESKLLTVNDTPSEGKGEYVVYSLVSVPAKPIQENDWRYDNDWNWIPSLDMQLKDVANDKKIESGETIHDKEGKAIIQLKPLPAGTYRIVEKTKDKGAEEITQEKIFIVAKDGNSPVPVDAGTVMLVEKDEYQVGETAHFVMGSGITDGFYVMELWCGGYFLKNEFIGKGFPERGIHSALVWDKESAICSWSDNRICALERKKIVFKNESLYQRNETWRNVKMGTECDGFIGKSS